MSVVIEETFQVAAPPDRVWAYLVDPQQVVGCLPGAALTEVQDERNFLGTVKIKVGPVTAAYKGKVQITEQDAATRTVRMLGEGMESSGAGSAKMVLTSEVVVLDDGTTEVRVQQEVEVVGKLAQFGRGMVQEVGKQLFRQFVACAKAHLESEAAAGAPSSAAAGPSDDGGPATAGAPEPSTTPLPQAQPQDEAVGAIGLIFKALWAMITRPFRKS